MRKIQLAIISSLLLVGPQLFSQVSFTTPGTYTWTVPPCVTSVTVKVWGGGGGGGGAIAITRNSAGDEACSGAGGGGGAGFSMKTFAVTPGETYNILVGAGGIAGSSGNGTWSGGVSTAPSAGGTGGQSSFTGFSQNIIGNGGTGGGPASSYNTGTGGGTCVSGVGAAGTGGTGSGGTNYTGGNAAAGNIISNGTDRSGGGGGAAGPGGNGGNATMPAAPGVSVGGAGQTPGGKGGDGRVWNLPSNQAYNGNNGGASYGAGGGGALVHQGSYGVGKGNGGLGGNGAVIIEYTPSSTPPAQPSPISGNPNLCDVNSGTYSVTNVAGVTYTWTYTGTATVTPSGNSVALTNITSGGTLTVTPSNACGNGPSQSIIIQIATSSIAPVSIIGTGPYCHGNTVTLTQNGGSLSGSSIYQWYTGSCGGTLVGTGPSITITPSATTTYYVRASANAACPATTCASGTVTLPTPGTTLALNGESATCIVNAGETVLFYEPVSGRYIGTITANAIGLGLTTNTVYVDIGNQMPAACVYDFSQTAVMERHWGITPTVNASAKVRLPYSLTEYNNLVSAAAVSSNPYDGVSSQNDIKLSKYSNTINPALVNNNASDNCPSGTTTIHSYSAIGVNNPAPSVNAQYSDFNIPGFSEFWLHGSSNNSPLPVELLNFSAVCDKNTVQITWQTATETNNDYFIVEKSMNAETWTEVNMQPGAGNSNSTQTYTFTDAKPFNGTSYYRLRQVDYNGTIDVFAPVSVSCMSSTETDYITVYPNPNNGAFTIHLNAGNAYGVGIIEITDLLGRKVLSEKIEVQEGGNTYSLSDERLAAGTYHVSIVLNGVALLMDKLVIQ